MEGLGKEYEMTIHTGILTYVGSVVITFVVSMLVALLVIRKTKRISMVEALKGNE
jgi:ABC-type antimicrobial peptide transport system permease subunit